MRRAAPVVPSRFVAPSACVATGLLLLLAAATPAVAGDNGWPRAITSEGARVVMYQPQPDGREETIITARAAVAITPKGATEPTFGTVWLRARMDVDREKREVRFDDITVPRVRFPGSKPEQEARLVALLEKEIPKWDLVIGLDRLIASLQAVETAKATEDQFNQAPPAIVVRDEPTFLLVLDGEPVLRPVEGTNVIRIVNSPYFLVSDGRNYWLPGGSIWFKTGDLKEKWSTSWKPSDDVASYYAVSRANTMQPVPGKSDKKARFPDILVATVPTELVVTEGEPTLVPLEGIDLQYVGNTKSHLFMSVADQRWYLLVSGRWFRAAGLEGAWEFVRSDALPEAFRKIPESSPIADVRASVAGTQEAQEALFDAQAPQTSAIKRGAPAPRIVYDGEPRFEPIEGTSIAYAVNTASQVFLIGGKHYVCDQGVWFVGDDPKGPFVVADTVPAEIQKIPPDHPGYNTKYVSVYDSTDEVVYVGYTSGYLGSYPWYGTVVWGTGWYYPPYVSPHFYYPHPVTYGFAVGYNPYGGWSVGVGVGFTYGAFTFGFMIGGAYGGYWGPCYRPPMYYPGYPGGGGGYPGYGGRPVAPAGGARPTPHGTNGNLYARDANSARNAATTRPAGGQAPSTLANSPNNLYSDRDGSVARRGSDGSWQSRDGGSWKGGQGAGASSLERDYQARQRGSQGDPVVPEQQLRWRPLDGWRWSEPIDRGGGMQRRSVEDRETWRSGARILAAAAVFVAVAAGTGARAGEAAKESDEDEYVTFTDEHPLGQVKPDQALLYVMRPTSVGFAIKSYFFIDDEVLGINRGSSYFFVDVAPGQRVLWSKSENVDALEATFEAGKIYYIQQQVQMGGFRARTKLLMLDETEGQKALGKCKKHGTMGEAGRVKGREYAATLKANVQEDLDRRAREAAEAAEADKKD